MRFSTQSRLGLSLLLLLVLATGLGLYSSSRGVAQAASPHVWLSQTIGPPTANVQVHGYGFGVNETVLAYFDDTTQIGSTTTDAKGKFVVHMIVPKSALPGTHSVRATGQSSGLTALALFLVRTDWSQIGFGPYHTGHNPYENILSSSNVSALTLDWIFPAKSYSSPAVVNGVVYVGSDDSKLYALDAVTGKRKWSYATGGGVDSSPAIVNGIVYVGSDKLYALDAVTGAFKWSDTLGYAIAGSSPVVANGVVYVGSFGGTLYAIDAVTGTFKWSYTTGGYITTSPAVVNGVVYIGSDKLYALDALTGALKWSYTTGNVMPDRQGIGSSPAVVNGIVYVGANDGTIYALDALTGALKWSYLAGNVNYVGGIPVYPALANGVVYVGSLSTGTIYALDALTGALKWSYTTGYCCIGSSPAVANDVVYVGDDGGLFALDALTGALKWSHILVNWLPYSQAVANGVVYVTSGYSGNMYAFHLPGMS
jgi:outer membrane protein assembly factor BamB